MKIVNRTEFLKLPVGTVYSPYEPCAFTDLCIKGESITNDWFQVSIMMAGNDGAVEDFTADEHKAGRSFPMDFDCEGRDGLYEPADRLYAVYDRVDVLQLIARLQLAATGESVYTLEAKAKEPK